MPQSREKILVAMSGGVDSSVAALVLKQQGFDIAGAYMKNWINEDNIVGDCPWQRDIEDARAVAEKIGIEFRVVNLMREYSERVVAYLLDGYKRGITPNPDVMCNREIKFGVFLAWARDHGFDAVATGHYARRVESPGGAFSLVEGADKNKDQSYFLALINQEQLRAARFPIGHLPKPELRRLATEAGLATAAKKDSQGICFIGEVKMQDFLRQYVPDEPGPIVRATDGQVLGRHRGLHYYTIGQRRGIGVPSNADFQKYVVVGKRAADRALLVAFDAPDAPGLFTSEVRVHSLSWVGEPVTAPCLIEGRVRYRDPRVHMEFIPDPENTSGGSATVRFREPQRALASGQVLALYDGERLLGGGIYV
ncbi:tRNA-specific 2-thiouridylase [Ereboglobus sp. PH5-10]|uniref:tRNA 2-thiouridine(34) synthase MnmA n=1 Tax=Ereboglobus sp. PH5-10 TaxID=2940629 RepID=UPI002404D397|nr:tRNA 2-thiouridine(34) synthase MnmA [Ereboglobus sp. PH5-10]MDF9826268.1 tRNA-specific 2-thiouridylase [Ereboglobus sp. PH5-10]